jgi:hypothetical protein
MDVGRIMRDPVTRWRFFQVSGDTFVGGLVVLRQAPGASPARSVAAAYEAGTEPAP